ncbi:ribosomal protein S18 acetylase RimI-like enzyme [Inquilinus ginsengisoli]|jgi:ribosomal protein S18 acetylase RimI-like enzyme|uniref:GNAT family N-acetyltransferase n=1 Tax=Inquilinus ginsengisoli TaxID=363840 RepID=UPI003D1B697D
MARDGIPERMMDVTMRAAEAADLPAILRLLADDPLGKNRETAVDAPYQAAFAAITADPNQEVMVAELDGRVVGCFQLSFIPGLSRRGAWRAQIESVRIDSALRGRGAGQAMMDWAIARARARGCALVQLTTDKRRPDAHRFYARLGFVASHEGMKLEL